MLTYNNTAIHGIIAVDIQCNLEPVGVHRLSENSVRYVLDCSRSPVELPTTTVHCMLDVYHTKCEEEGEEGVAGTSDSSSR